MLGQNLRHGESKRRDGLSRDLDRYPRNIAADFRHLSASSLRKVCRHFKLEVNADGSSSKPELSRMVARHFEKEFELKEDVILQNFVKYTNDFANAHRSQGSRVHKRYGTRSARNSVNGDDSDESRSTGAATPMGHSDQPVYCICKRVSYGEMIGCDNDDCLIEWFHIGCVGVKPGSIKGQIWYCSDCRLSKAKEEEANAKAAAEAAAAADSAGKKGTKKGVKKEASKAISVNATGVGTGTNGTGSATNKRKKPSSATNGNSAGSNGVEKPTSRGNNKKARTDINDSDKDESGKALQDNQDRDPDVDALGRSTLTYSEMIARALESYPKKTATFKEICDKMEERFKDALNWKPESEIRKSPVWKSSVRKILLSHQRFQKADQVNYTLAPPKY